MHECIASIAPTSRAWRMPHARTGYLAYRCPVCVACVFLVAAKNSGRKFRRLRAASTWRGLSSQRDRPADGTMTRGRTGGILARVRGGRFSRAVPRRSPPAYLYGA